MASERVNPYALKEAAFICDKMLVKRLDVGGSGFGRGIEFPEIAEEQFAGGGFFRGLGC